ncbi:MmgE/PrpD family protein [Sulfolobus acidocaldarius]|uniref:MmgE family protein n=4 Tax=Sulfolobus acidocaldarius TaxID=2285 RepID=Q4JC17_SULAC|nr:MmgE/PrpD family protein [Sulfolobus acidocaldarius]AAY79662.1 MmgE family protein [Sulfolobus acidocaldarius DSM 639]AGE70220.1 MmgE family protein [Sulfolobus acidocaldarius N8]AGE72495.1 MmgE family protein [Sulfolobus acidocaldarius Ron12/I]ALU29372.1 2-methylcitrate dehydratase [Sulfolobus acidocaldarius]ALU32101.1 2-methylcitrate dehydratase [Sulfolobus acidocaldarius]
MELSDTIAEFASSVTKVSDDVVKEVKKRVLDSIAVALASINSQPAKVAQETAKYFPGEAPMLNGMKASPDFASFYNTLLIRYLDFNDTYLSLEPLHPSDMIGGLLTLASIFDLKGEDLIRAIAVGYEVGVNLCDTTSLRKKGFDHVNFLGIGAAAGMANLLSLDKEKAKNAISLTIVPHVALRETRSGKLSMWKAGATAEAVRNAVFATLMAKNGFTGPELPFSGVFGFSTIIAKDMDSSKFKLTEGKAILRTMLKKYPVEYHAEALVEAGMKINYEGEIKKIVVETYEAGKSILADTEDKWKPRNKETADHSIPFIITVTLLKKYLWLDSYNLIGYKELEELMKRVEVVEREDYTKVYARELPTKVTVITSKGEYSAEVRVPRGHYANPMSEDEVVEKAKKLGMSEKQINSVLQLDTIKVRELVRAIKEG